MLKPDQLPGEQEGVTPVLRKVLKLKRLEDFFTDDSPKCDAVEHVRQQSQTPEWQEQERLQDERDLEAWNVLRDRVVGAENLDNV